MQVITGNQIWIFRALAIKRGLLLYNDTRLKLNTGWTPKRMLKAASGITGKTYKRGEYLKAARDLENWAVEQTNER
jgi:hypothetical protein